MLLVLFNYAVSTASGGHFLITLMTLLMGLSSPVRTTLYVIAQFIGAALGGGLLRAGFGVSRPEALRSIGCFLDTETISSRGVFAFESAGSFVLL